MISNDLGEFNQKGSIETKYGCREDYLKAVEIAQKRVESPCRCCFKSPLRADDKNVLKWLSSVLIIV